MPTKPYHHGDLKNALIEASQALLAERGPDNFSLRADHPRGGDDPRLALREQGVEYVLFALPHPGPFRLLFRDGIDTNDAELARQANDAFMVLANGVRAAYAVAPDASLDAGQWTALVALWSTVHGYA